MKNYNTKQKIALIQCLKANKDSQLSISDLSILLSHTDIGKSTLYRLMKNLEDEGIVRPFTGSNSKSVVYQYIDNDSNCKNHLHMKCTNCGKVFHLECECSMEITEHLNHDHNFDIDKTRTVIYGTCSNCKNNK